MDGSLCGDELQKLCNRGFEPSVQLGSHFPRHIVYIVTHNWTVNTQERMVMANL